MVSHNLEKKLIKVSQKRGEIIYLYKSININYFITFIYIRFYQNFKKNHLGKLNKTYLMNICFA